MQLNLTGLFGALATFLGIWWGHVAVRKIEANSVHIWPPMLLCLVLGMGSEVVAALTENVYLSVFLGITGVLFFWDSFEFIRQQNRVKIGHAPANPDNPRHRSILSTCPEATTLNWLERDPRGREYSIFELDEIRKGAK